MEGSQFILSEECRCTPPSCEKIRGFVSMQRWEKSSLNHTCIQNGLIYSFCSFKVAPLVSTRRKELPFPTPPTHLRQTTHKQAMGKMRNKEAETLYPVSMALYVSQCPAPIIHSSFTYLSLHGMKEKQKPKSSWLAWCFCVKALLVSRPSLHPVPTSLQPWPHIIFQTQSSSSSSSPFTSSLLFSTSTRIKRS